MRTDMERRVLTLLRGGHALERADREAIINQLGPEGLAVLRSIARGDTEVEHEKLRLKAIAALGSDEVQPDESAGVLWDLVSEAPPVAVQAVRALGRSSARPSAQLRSLVRDPRTPPPVALAAARVAAEEGGDDVVSELRALRRRLRPYVDSDDSPSLLSIDRLIAQAQSGVRPESGPRPIA